MLLASGLLDRWASLGVHYVMRLHSYLVSLNRTHIEGLGIVWDRGQWGFNVKAKCMYTQTLYGPTMGKEHVTMIPLCACVV